MQALDTEIALMQPKVLLVQEQNSWKVLGMAYDVVGLLKFNYNIKEETIEHEIYVTST